MTRTLLAASLSILGVVTVGLVGLQAAGSASAADEGALTYFELVAAGDIASIATPLAGITALAAGIGLWLRKAWGAWLALALGLAGAGFGLFLAAIAIGGWSEPGSFAPIVLAGAAVALVVGGAVAYGAWRTLAIRREGVGEA